jgi:hypothetical protein
MINIQRANDEGHEVKMLRELRVLRVEKFFCENRRNLPSRKGWQVPCG